MVLPRQLIYGDFEAVPSFNDCLDVELKRKRSDAGSKIEFWGLAATFPGRDVWTVAELPLAPEMIRTLAKLIHRTRPTGAASVEYMQKRAGEPSFALDAKMGRFGRATILFQKMPAISRKE